MRFSAFPCLALAAGLCAPGVTRAAASLAYAPAPADNPLKGFVPYAGQGREFPHSLEFNYLPLRALMTGPASFDWQPLEQLLHDITNRHCQAVFRIYLEYPGKPIALPQFLLDQGLLVRRWTNTNTAPFPPQVDHTPDYENPHLRRALTNFIHALGRRYDGDPRVGFITAGLLGTWGEWHCYPHTEWFASKAVQAEVMDAYEAAFQTTPVLLRYPAGTNEFAHAPNHTRRLGYHDDSFAWATLDTGRKGDEWFFLATLKRGGQPALDKWRTQPIGGEIRPELWPCIWTEQGCGKGQDYFQCVDQTHATWLMDTSTSGTLSPADKERALRAARRLGYEFHVMSVDILTQARKGAWTVTATVTNLGVAPFYRDWPVELAVADLTGKLRHTWRPGWKLTHLLPGDPPRRWETTLPANLLPGGRYTLLLRVPNPMPHGRPLRFANQSQDQHQPGWLTLGIFQVAP